MSFYHDEPLIGPEAFQELERKRSAERKERIVQKRKEGLRQIKGMNLKSGVNPLELFPKEIWLQIFDGVNPEDRGTAYKVHPVFANLIDSNWDRVEEYLLPRTLKFVLNYMKNNDKSMGWSMKQEVLEEGPRPHLNIPFVKLRKVSKSLRFLVDRWFEDELRKELFECPEERPSDWRKMPRMTLRHLCREDMIGLNGLIRNYSTAAANDPEIDPEPSNQNQLGKVFFLRSLKVEVSLNHRDEMEPDQFIAEDDRPRLRNNRFLPFKSAFNELLDLVGDQILYFKLIVKPIKYFDVAGITTSDFYEALREYCQLMPNLLRLDVFFEIGEGMVACDYHEITEESLRSLTNFIQSHPFPTLSKMEKLCLEQDYTIIAVSKIYDAILKANAHVQMLRLRIDDEDKLLPLDSLSDLRLKWFSSPWTTSSYLFTWRLNYAFWKYWPLTTLEVCLKSIDFKSVLGSLEQFPALENLSLSMSDIRIGTEFYFLDLPNLTQFRCEIGGKFDYEKDDINFLFSLQFLLYSKKLKRIYWRCDRLWTDQDEDLVLRRFLDSHEYPEKMIDFKGGCKDMNSSNVWKIFPELEHVDIGRVKRGYYNCTTHYCRPN